jgi:hypothetical protein
MTAVIAFRDGAELCLVAVDPEEHEGPDVLYIDEPLFFALEETPARDRSRLRARRRTRGRRC